MTRTFSFISFWSLWVATGVAGCSAALTLEGAPCAISASCPGRSACVGGRCLDPTEPVADLSTVRRTLAVVADVTVVGAGESMAFNAFGQDALLCGSDGRGGRWRSYLAFDLAPVRGSPEVVGAFLRLRGRSDLALPPTPIGEPPAGRVPEHLELRVYRAAAPWRAERITWTNQPGATGEPVARLYVKPGADATVPLTELMGDWIRGAIGPVGLVLVCDEAGVGPRRAAYYSSAAASAGTHPVIEAYVR